MTVLDLTTPNPLEEDDLFEMANLYPRETGLPMTVWVSNRGRARHDVRVKVCRIRGNRMDTDETAVVGVRPEPRLIEGPLAPSDLKLVVEWIKLNEATIIGYWDGSIDTGGLIRGLKPMPRADYP